jgi:hypothetical protein
LIKGKNIDEKINKEISTGIKNISIFPTNIDLDELMIVESKITEEANEIELNGYTDWPKLPKDVEDMFFSLTRNFDMPF